MKVLVANLLLAQRTGTEVFTEQLADGLRRAGHDVVVWVSKIGPQGLALRHRGHIVIDRLDQLPWQPDIIHGHHNVMTATALAALPGTPAIFVCHDASASFDTPPLHPRIRSYLAVDELCRRRVIAGGIKTEATSLLLNAVDEMRYIQRKSLPQRPARALVLTKQSGHLGAVRSACKQAGLKLDELGSGVIKLSDALEEVFPSYDIVFATARMALEAAFAGCSVVVCDERGLAGRLTSDNLLHWREWNFGRGILSQPTNHETLFEALSGYDAEDSERVTDYLRAQACLSQQVEDLVGLYNRCVQECASSTTDPLREAQAIARFMEDWLPSPAQDRPWKTLADEMAATETDVSARLITRVREEFFQHLSDGLASMGSETTARQASFAFRKWSVPAKAFKYNIGKLESDHIIVPMAEQEGFVVYGPYESRPKGSYEVFFDISIHENISYGKIYLDVAVDAGAVVKKEISMSDFDYENKESIKFFLTEDFNSIEYRIHVSGFNSGFIKFGGVTLIKD